MLFNSIDFAVFLPVVFLLFWLAVPQSAKQQNLLLLVASYFFYGWWDWRFLLLILLSTLVEFFMGIEISKEKNDSYRKKILWLSILFNLSILFFFKYFNFFVESFNSTFTFFGNTYSLGVLHIVLPVGISFYTFQTISYTIDVYRRQLAPTKDFVAYATYVAFFPQLVAGPIERATRFLPQFSSAKVFNYSKSVDGLRQILWGMFKKVVIADGCAGYVNHVFDNPAHHSGSTLVLAVLLFSFQIYCDFSGYSDIAIGTAKLFGFDLMKNFSFPYFANSLKDFWRRWHISLTSWFRDYIYISLGGGNKGLKIKVRNILVVFLLSGLWHGANWTFVLWGIGHAFFYILPIIFFKVYIKKPINKPFSAVKEFFKWGCTFMIVSLLWVLFRSKDFNYAMVYYKRIFSLSVFTLPDINNNTSAMYLVLSLLVLFFIVEWLGRTDDYAIQKIVCKRSRFFRWAFYLFLISCVFCFFESGEQFIYFQF